jgi:hypothetical protein
VVGAVIIIPGEPPRTSELLDADGRVIARARRHKIIDAHVRRLDETGQPQSHRVPMYISALTSFERVDPPEEPLEFDTTLRSYEWEMTLTDIDPVAVRRLFFGELIIP